MTKRQAFANLPGYRELPQVSDSEQGLTVMHKWAAAEGSAMARCWVLLCVPVLLWRPGTSRSAPLNRIIFPFVYWAPSAPPATTAWSLWAILRRFVVPSQFKSSKQKTPGLFW